MSKTKSTRRAIIGALTVLTMAGVGYGVTASNTVSASKAGDGSGTVAGYSVTNVHYTLQADPTLISSVSFDLGAAASAGNVKAKLGGATWYSCALAGTVATCDTSTGTDTVLGLTSLRVIAAE